MSSNCDQETVPTPPAAKRRKISNSDGETNSVSHENHLGKQASMSDGNGNMDGQMQIDEGLYSRQLYVLGHEAMKKNGHFQYSYLRS